MAFLPLLPSILEPSQSSNQPTSHLQHAPLRHPPCFGLLLRQSHEGDVALQPVASASAAAVKASQAQQQQQLQESHPREQQQARQPTHRLTQDEADVLVQRPDFGDIRYKLMARYRNQSTAQGLILGRKVRTQALLRTWVPECVTQHSVQIVCMCKWEGGLKSNRILSHRHCCALGWLNASSSFTTFHRV